MLVVQQSAAFYVVSDTVLYTAEKQFYITAAILITTPLTV